MPRLPGSLAASLLRRAARAWPPSLKDAFLCLHHAIRAGAALFVASLMEKEIPPVAVGAVILALSDLLTIAARAIGGGRTLKFLRWSAFGAGMAGTAGLFLLGGFHASRGGRGDEVGLVYPVLAIPLFLLSLFHSIPFDPEETGPL